MLKNIAIWMYFDTKMKGLICYTRKIKITLYIYEIGDSTFKIDRYADRQADTNTDW